jgi:hypothetical protein
MFGKKKQTSGTIRQKNEKDGDGLVFETYKNVNVRAMRIFQDEESQDQSNL